MLAISRFERPPSTARTTSRSATLRIGGNATAAVETTIVSPTREMWTSLEVGAPIGPEEFEFSADTN